MDELSHPPQPREPVSAPASMADFDESRYRPYLDGFDLTDEQKVEFVRAMWKIMRAFVELNVPSETWGKVVEAIIEPPLGSFDALD